MLWPHRRGPLPFGHSWLSRCHACNAEVPKCFLLLCKGMAFVQGCFLILKGEPRLCSAYWLLLAIMSGRLPVWQVAQGKSLRGHTWSGLLNLAWRTQDTCHDSHVSQLPQVSHMKMPQPWDIGSSLHVFYFVLFPQKPGLILDNVTMPRSPPPALLRTVCG